MKIDDKFLEEVGLTALPAEQKNAFLNHVQEELEVRVGERMSEGMTVEQLTEFEGIMANDREVIHNQIAKLGDYRSDPVYIALMKKYNAEIVTWEILGEFLSIKWIQNNRPDYREVVASVTEQLKTEIASQKDQILGKTV